MENNDINLLEAAYNAAFEQYQKAQAAADEALKEVNRLGQLLEEAKLNEFARENCPKDN